MSVAEDPRVLLGDWRLRRRLRDDVAGVSARVAGRLTLAADGAGVRWDESGLLRWLGRDLEVHRVYRLEPRDDGWWVLFEDGRPFHPWQPGHVVEHPCVADVYRGAVHLDGIDTWRTIWDVRGPRKRQRILTRFDR